MDRKPLSKKTRFEVFKRDQFTCQYCGNKPPNTTLEIDHIKAVSKGGNDEIINLITSCFDCNIDISIDRVPEDRFFKYVCGVLWTKKKRREEK